MRNSRFIGRIAGFRVWTWLAVISSAAVCAAVTWVHVEQQRIVERTSELVVNFRRARADLAKGFLHVSLADQADSSFDFDQGIALMDLALAELQQSAELRSPDGELDADEAAALDAVTESARAFRAELAIVAGEAEPGLEGRRRLQDAFVELERRLDRLDRSNQRDLRRLVAELDRNFVVALGVGAVLLASVGVAMHLVGRAHARSLSALRAAEDRLQTVINSLAEGVLITDRRGELLQWNHAARRIHGVTRPEDQPTDGESYRRTFEITDLDGNTLPSENLPISRVLQGQHVQDLEVRLRRIDGGRERTISCNGAIAHDLSGRELAFLSFSDTTERVRAEQALRDSEARFRGLVEQSLAGIYVIAGNQFLYVSPGFAKIFGYESGDDIVNNVEVFDLVAPADRAKVRENIRRRLDGEIEDLHYEFIGLRRDRSQFNVEVQGRVLDYEGRRAVVGVLLDVSERKKLENQFLHAQKMEAIGTLAGGIAHDFNNVLTAILGFAGVARLDAANDPVMTGHIDSIAEASQRATDLVRQILAFSRMQSQSRQVIQLRHVIKEASRLLRATVPKTIKFELALSADAPPVLADVTQVHQVIMNLGTNAAHAMGTEPGELRIALEAVDVTAEFAATHLELQPGRYTRLSVSDTGHGMDAAVASRVFEPFFTTKNPGVGTGLGLSVVHGIMQSHEGAVRLYSQPGKGTRFDLYFPAHDAEVTEVAGEPEAVGGGNGECVMFVDDEEPLVRMGSRVLDHFGYEVEAFSDAEAAWKAFQDNPAKYDVVITDLTMPAMTGVDLATRILKKRPEMPIILATGFSATLTREKVKAMGIRELMLKPFSVQKLGETVRKALTAEVGN